jgi:hypothetical protein
MDQETIILVAKKTISKLPGIVIWFAFFWIVFDITPLELLSLPYIFLFQTPLGFRCCFIFFILPMWAAIIYFGWIKKSKSFPFLSDSEDE